MPLSPGQAGGADRGGVVDLADASDLAVFHGEVLGDAEGSDGPGVQVIRQHRLVAGARLFLSA
jgi:hypothetical protein